MNIIYSKIFPDKRAGASKSSGIRILLYSIFIVLVLIRCTKEEYEEPYIPIDEITASSTELFPDKDTKMVQVELQFANLEEIAFLRVVKSGGAVYNEEIDRSELSSPFVFQYKIKASDPESFKLVLSAVYNDGNESRKVNLNIDNRWGFFIRKVERIARVTGSPMDDEYFPSPNNTAGDRNVGGTDLGIIWEMDEGQYGVFFGDTFGWDFTPQPANPGPNGGSWRSNVLAFSENESLDEGLIINSMATDDRGNAREIIYSAKDNSGQGDFTSIPTAAIRANGNDYVHYFNMKNWDGWVTNYSGMYKSEDDGKSWSKCKDIIFSANSNFGQAGYFKKDGFVYMIGTHAGRDYPAHLARFLEKDIENRDRYEYWDGGEWIRGDENQATIIIDDQVGELSVIYNQKHEKWIIAYFNGERYNITLRTAKEITGPWSEPYELASGHKYSQLYGSYFHPKSTEGDDLFFTMSMWLPYNVFLMKATLADMGKF